MKRIGKLLLLVCLSVYLGGCASIVSSSSRNVTISTEPAQAKIEIFDKENKTIHTSETPHTLSMDASAGFFQPAAYRIKATKDGYFPMEADLKASMNGWYFGNLLFGGLIGILIIDPATGAMWKLDDDKIHLKLYEDSTIGKITMARELYNGAEPLDEQDYSKTVYDTTKAIELYPEYLEAYARRSMAYDALGKTAKALEDFKKATELEPENASAYQVRGDLLASKKQIDKALADYNKALELSPSDPETLFKRGQLYSNVKDFDKARPDFAAACEKGHEKACNFQFPLQ